jgi:hypothetical protein
MQITSVGTSARRTSRTRTCPGSTPGTRTSGKPTSPAPPSAGDSAARGWSATPACRPTWSRNPAGRMASMAVRRDAVVTLRRLVTITVQPGALGINSATCASEPALSNTMTIRLPCTRLRNNAERSAAPRGSPPTGHPTPAGTPPTPLTQTRPDHPRTPRPDSGTTSPQDETQPASSPRRSPPTSYPPPAALRSPPRRELPAPEQVLSLLAGCNPVMPRDLPAEPDRAGAEPASVPRRRRHRLLRGPRLRPAHRRLG